MKISILLENRFGFCRALLALLALGQVLGVRGQWVTQTINLKPGWNAVFLEVQPQPTDVDSVFAGLPIESAWQWNRPERRIDYVQDASELTPQSAEWLTYLPLSHPRVFVRNLFDVVGGRPLLINVSGSQAVTWTMVGRPVNVSAAWVPDSFNLVGTPLVPNSTHTFTTYFAGSAAHRGMSVLRLNTVGKWEALDAAGQARERIEQGRAYWISIRGASDFSSPLRVGTDEGAALAYGGFLNESRLRVLNQGAVARPISVDLLPSATPPAGFPPLAGAVPLFAWQFATVPDLDGNLNPSVNWRAVSDLSPATVEPNQELSLRLEVRRGAMTPLPATAPASAVYQSVLQVRDSLGARVLVPVSALSGPKVESKAGVASLGGGSLRATSALDNPRAGLWIGNATVRAVNHTAHASDRTMPLPTGSEFDFRILIHVDRHGQTRLLQKALLSWKNGVANDPSQPGRYVLFTDEAKARTAGYVGTSLRDGAVVPRRFSAPAFSFREPVPMVATGSFGDGILKCSIELGYDDPLNPFVHRPHPDHDNLDDQNPPQPLPAGIESFTVSRSIELRFATNDPENLKIPGWGDNRLGGQYLETLSGLHRLPLNVSGTFSLRRATAIADLNDQN